MAPPSIFGISLTNKYVVIFILIISLIIYTLYKNQSLRHCVFEMVNKKPIKAIATFNNPKISPNLNGTVQFIEDLKNKHTIVKVNITGVPPGKHGFHVHEYGDLTNLCDSAGDHFNPTKSTHGDVDKGHVGDLGNVTADSSGVVNYTIHSTSLKLRGPHSIIGRTIIIHEDEDDLGKGNHSDSKTTGHSGKRIGCAVIGLSK